MTLGKAKVLASEIGDKGVCLLRDSFPTRMTSGIWVQGGGRGLTGQIATVCPTSFLSYIKLVTELNPILSLTVLGESPTSS